MPQVHYNFQGHYSPLIRNFLNGLYGLVESRKDSINVNISQTGASASNVAVTQIARHDKVSVSELCTILDKLQERHCRTQRGGETPAAFQGTSNCSGCQGGVTNYINIAGQGSAGVNAVTLLVNELQRKGDQDQFFTLSEVGETCREMGSQDEVPPGQRQELNDLAEGVESITRPDESFSGRYRNFSERETIYI